MLLSITPGQLGTIMHWFRPERPGPTIAQHVVGTGVGRCLVDRWPRPRVVIAQSADNYALAGDPAALAREALRRKVIGFVDAPAEFTPSIRAAADEVHEWPRLIFTLEGPFDGADHGDGFLIRRLGRDDAESLAGLDGQISWISKTWGGPAGLARSEMAWGAFAGGRLAAVCCPFFCGERHEDLGVVTEPDFRGLGLSPACARAVCRDIRRRGHIPTWTTSPENTASLQVAAKLGGKLQRRDRLLVVGIPVPPPAKAPGGPPEG
jgi:GNAT superfamily N-acetyltransferase